jgi:glycosyltransferase involved in cell wall biosynthesis
VSASSARALDAVVAHDYLTQRGGAERVALEVARTFAARDVVTSVYAPERTFDGFAGFEVHESRSRALHRLNGDMRRALPFLAGAWSRLPPISADVVVCSSSGWAHGVRTTAGTLKVVYCHNPARWLYQRDDYVRGHPPAVRLALQGLSPSLRRWDQRAAATADVYIANSTSVAARVHRVYGIDAEVIHPPVTIDVGGPQEPVAGVSPGAFLTVSRARGYKGTQRLIAAFAGMPRQRLVIVGMPAASDLPANVVAVGQVSDSQLRWLYAGSRALISVSREDFGLTPVEAGAFGTPALLLRAGGFLDSTEEGVSGAFIENESVEAITRAVGAFPDDWNPAAVQGNAARFSPDAFGSRLRAVIASAL